MFNYDYDDYFVEPSEFEKIVSEAEENIKELFNERVKSVIDDVKEKEKRLKELESQGFGKVRDPFTVVKKVKISRVDLTLCFRKDKVSYWTIECIYVDGDDSRCTVENLFKTEEEAQKEAGRRNKENNKSV